jgi:hypothetical protein
VLCTVRSTRLVLSSRPDARARDCRFACWAVLPPRTPWSPWTSQQLRGFWGSAPLDKSLGHPWTGGPPLDSGWRPLDLGRQRRSRVYASSSSSSSVGHGTLSPINVSNSARAWASGGRRTFAFRPAFRDRGVIRLGAISRKSFQNCESETG